MWPEKLKYPLLEPDENRIKDFRMPNTASHLQGSKKVQTKSPVMTNKCIGCGECKKICPRQAIKIVDDTAVVDYSECIRCYCCHEICPVNAIKLISIKKEKI